MTPATTSLAIPAGSGPLALVLRVRNTLASADYFSVPAFSPGIAPVASNGFTTVLDAPCQRLNGTVVDDISADCPSLQVRAQVVA